VLFVYFDVHSPAQLSIDLPAGSTYRAEYVDSLKMMRTALGDSYSGRTQLTLPGTALGSVWFYRKA
jgi:hypothetical protein